MKTLSAFLVNHKCDEYKCQLCYETYNINDEDKHLCKLKSSKNQELYPNLAFFDIETLVPTSNPENCECCIEKEIAYVKEHFLTSGHSHLD